MSGFLLVWYCCGWVATGMYCRKCGELTLFGLVVNLCSGGLAMLGYLIAMIIDSGVNPVVWKKD